MRTPGHVRAGLAWVASQLERDQIDPKRANALIYAYSTLANVIESTELEVRLAALEAGAR